MRLSDEVRQEIIDQVAEVKESSPEAAVVLRGLTELYFASKGKVNTGERAFLLGEVFGFTAESKIPYAEGRSIFEEVAAKHRRKPMNID